MSPDIHQEIERVAYDLYEQSGRKEGRDLINWLAAERIVLGRLARSGRIVGEDAGAGRNGPPARRGGRKRRMPS
jgi:hypothetical protein